MAATPAEFASGGPCSWRRRAERFMFPVRADATGGKRTIAIEITCCPHCKVGHWQLVQQLPAERAALTSNVPRTVACRGPP